MERPKYKHGTIFYSAYAPLYKMANKAKHDEVKKNITIMIIATLLICTVAFFI